MSGTTLLSSEAGSAYLLETVQLTQDFLDTIILKINIANTEEFHHEFHLNNMVASLTQDISQFVEVTTLMSKVMMQRKMNIPQDIKNSHVHLLFIMKGMGQAASKVDIVALEDLIKYELKDNLTQWKIDLIPQIKRLLKA